MQIFTDKDFPDEKPQFLQIVSNGQCYRMHPLHVNMDEEHTCKFSEKFSEHSHDVYHIVLYGPGTGKFSFQGRLISAEAGLLVLSSPGEGHIFPPVTKGNLSYSEFTFSYDSGKMGNLRIPFRELIALYFGLSFPEWNSVVFLDEVPRAELRDILNRISQFKESESALRFFRFYRSVSDLFAFLALVQAPKNMEGENDFPSRLSKARDYIHSHYDSKISLEKLASIACVSKGHFQRAFKMKYGVSPVTYINQYRISAAKNLLSTTSLSCAEIAEEVGFDDIFYFSKVFKKVTGRNPKSLRK
ncbi:MAG: AraC family transcriptional regulator [Lentisphaerota bacterium]